MEKREPKKLCGETQPDGYSSIHVGPCGNGEMLNYWGDRDGNPYSKCKDEYNKCLGESVTSDERPGDSEYGEASDSESEPDDAPDSEFEPDDAPDSEPDEASDSEYEFSEGPGAKTERGRLEAADLAGKLAVFMRYVKEIRNFDQRVNPESLEDLKEKKRRALDAVKQEFAKIRQGNFQTNSTLIGWLKKTINYLEKGPSKRFLTKMLKILEKNSTKGGKNDCCKELEDLMNEILPDPPSHQKAGSPPEKFGSRGFWPAFVSGAAVVLMSAVLGGVAAV